MQFLKKFLSRLLVCALAATLLGGCAGTPVQEGTNAPLTPQLKLTAADQTTAAEAAAPIDLNAKQNTCLISTGGAYILSGELNGSIRVDAEDQIVHLILAGVSVKASYGPALEVLSAGKVILTAKEETENTLQDSGYYPVSGEADACIYSVCDLTVNGSGALRITGLFQDAIHSKDTLKLLAKSCAVKAKRDGLHGNDGIVVCSEDLDVQCERNGLHSTKTGKPGKGNIEIYGSACAVIGGNYAIRAAADLYIADSRVQAKGIHGTVQAAGRSYIAEGSLQND